jgi:hypothetical protein
MAALRCRTHSFHPRKAQQGPGRLGMAAFDAVLLVSIVYAAFHLLSDLSTVHSQFKIAVENSPYRSERDSSRSYLQSTLLSCAATIRHLPSRFNQVSVQTWHCFASGCVLSLPMARSLP